MAQDTDQQFIDNLITVIWNAEDPDSVTNEMVARVLDFLNNSYKGVKGLDKSINNVRLTLAKVAGQLSAELKSKFASLIPTGLTVEAIDRITFGNTAPNRITAALLPSGTLHNVIFISDNKSVEVDQQGNLRVVGKGVSRVYVIPTCNTALAKTILINVEDPTARLTDSSAALRLAGDGSILKN